MSIGAFPTVCAELIQASPAWQQMVAQIRTVQTQAFQLWLNKDAKGLGWNQPERAVVGAYVEPLDTWADMTQVLDKESWPPQDNARNIAYFCGVLDEMTIPPITDCQFPTRETARVKQNALTYLQRSISVLWPHAADPANPAGLDWNTLVDPGNNQGVQRFDSQYWRANINPSERYALSLKGTIQNRLRADAAGFDNLFLAGDWTHNGVNLGCVEAATMSGLQASRAICGQPQVIVGETDIE
jgi:uncharacterized protein with NAD-binding domain and iron-sulfur cluster